MFITIALPRKGTHTLLEYVFKTKKNENVVAYIKKKWSTPLPVRITMLFNCRLLNA